MLAVSVIWPYAAYAQKNKAIMVKAAFIYNFVKFVEWPGAKAINNQNNIDICVLGESDMIAAGSVFRAASNNTLSLTLLQENTASEVKAHCHVVFVSDAQSDSLASILTAIDHSAVLTVSDMPGFVDAGGMIGFVNDDNKIRLEVNARAVAKAGMRIDAQLLEIALRVINR